MNKHGRNPPCPEDYVKPPVTPLPPPGRVIKCNMFGSCETEESKQATQYWLDNKETNMDNQKQYTIE